MNEVFQLNQASTLPKYRQLILQIIEGIEAGLLTKGEKIPSLNQLCELNDLSRDTVMMAFNELKTRGVILSRPGKGYFIQNTQVKTEQRIFVLFDELNSFKEDMYNSFVKHLDKNTDVDIFFHHFNFKLFSELITNAVGNYTSYVIMPATFDQTTEIINQLPQDKVFILDRKKRDLEYLPCVYQDFQNDVYEALLSIKELVANYTKIVFVHPGGKEPHGRVVGFEKFANENQIKSLIVSDISSELLVKDTLFLIISDRTLVKLIKIAEEKKLKLGTDIGIISFNDTVLKEVVAGGISTISTDFLEMGKTLAKMIKNRSRESIRNPWRFEKRNSI